MTADKKTYSKRIIAIVLMIVALLSSVWFMQKFMCIPFSYDERRIINIHKEPENTIDVVLVGSSATYAGFSSVYAYEKYGFTSFPYAIGGATCTSWKPAVKDILHTQSPKLVVVDVFGGGYSRDLIDERHNQLSIIMSHTKLSREKVESAKELSTLTDNITPISFLVPFIKYHNNVPSCVRSLPERLRIEFTEASPLKGIDTKTRTRKLKKVDPASFSEDCLELDNKTEEIILDFIDYCKSENIKILFVKYPSVLTNNNPDELEVNLRANSILKLAADSGCYALNMQKDFYEIGLVEKKDYYNHGHTNIRGQRKVTETLGKFIQDEIAINPSVLDESNKRKWDDCIPYYYAYCELAEEMIQNEIHYELGDSPKLVDNLNRMLAGEDVAAVAKSYRKK